MTWPRKTVFHPGQRDGPQSRSVLPSQVRLFNEAADAYQDAVRKLELWKLEHPNAWPADSEKRNLEEAVARTKQSVGTAAEKLRETRDKSLTEGLVRRYASGKQRETKWKEELLYKDTWELVRQNAECARYEGLRALQELLNPFYTLIKRPQPTSVNQQQMETLQQAAGVYQRPFDGRALLLLQNPRAQAEYHMRGKRCDELEVAFKTQLEKSSPMMMAQLLLDKLNKKVALVEPKDKQKIQKEPRQTIPTG